MGRKKDLVDAEKQKIVEWLQQSLSSIEISKRLNRGHRTVINFIRNIHRHRKRSNNGKFRKVSALQQVLLKRAVALNPLTTSGNIFCQAGIQGMSRSTRWRVLQNVATV